jgi:hypothetical protein
MIVGEPDEGDIRVFQWQADDGAFKMRFQQYRNRKWNTVPVLTVNPDKALEEV